MGSPFALRRRVGDPLHGGTSDTSPMLKSYGTHDDEHGSRSTAWLRKEAIYPKDMSKWELGSTAKTPLFSKVSQSPDKCNSNVQESQIRGKPDPALADTTSLWGSNRTAWRYRRKTRECRYGRLAVAWYGFWERSENNSIRQEELPRTTDEVLLRRALNKVQCYNFQDKINAELQKSLRSVKPPLNDADV